MLFVLWFLGQIQSPRQNQYLFLKFKTLYWGVILLLFKANKQKKKKEGGRKLKVILELRLSFVRNSTSVLKQKFALWIYVFTQKHLL